MLLTSAGFIVLIKPPPVQHSVQAQEERKELCQEIRESSIMGPRPLWVQDTVEPNLLIKIVSNDPATPAKDISKKIVQCLLSSAGLLHLYPAPLPTPITWYGLK